MKGVVTALVTPFLNGEVDYKSLGRVVKKQLNEGVDGLVVNGTTAESPTLTEGEVKKIFDFVKSEVSGAVPLILGTGTNCTRTTIENTLLAKKWGAQAALVVVPYYNKPTQAGLLMHFSEVAEKAEAPILLYNVPSRTVSSLAAETTIQLSQNKNIIGIKDATGDMKIGAALVKGCRKDFVVLSGDDGTFLELAQIGGQGVISVISNLSVAPFKGYLKKPSEQSATYHRRFDELLKQLYIESNPIPVKMALFLMGIISSPELRLPLCTLGERHVSALKKALLQAELL